MKRRQRQFAMQWLSLCLAFLAVTVAADDKAAIRELWRQLTLNKPDANVRKQLMAHHGAAVDVAIVMLFDNAEPRAFCLSGFSIADRLAYIGDVRVPKKLE